LTFKLLGDHQRHRDHQQHRGDVVEERRHHRGDDGQHGENAGRVGLHLLRRPDGEVLEHAGLPGDRDDDHHPDQQADGVEVDALDRLLLCQDAESRSSAARREGR
jgi:hypothetical protein